MTKAEEALKEVEDQLLRFAPELEGLYDYRRLNLLDATRAEVEKSIASYEKRVALLDGAKNALVLLRDDGHTELPVREVSPEALTDLQANKSTIDAALARFTSNVATDMTLTGAVAKRKQFNA